MKYYFYTLTAVQSINSPFNPSISFENNIANCRLDDTSANVTLKVISSVTYNLTFTFQGETKISSNFFRSIGMLLLLDFSNILKKNKF